MKRLLLVILVAFAMNAVTQTAQAQYYPGYRPPVRPGYVAPGYVNPYYPQGSPGYNYMNGVADLNRANGEVIKDVEQAYQMREKTKQDRIDTKKKAFDEMLYEKANTPTYLEELSKEKSDLLVRLMNYPGKGEIANGKTLNVMLPYLDSLLSLGTQGPPVPIPQSMVNQLNISATGASVGMLRAGGEVEWPISLRGPQQRKIDKLLVAAVDGVVKNTLEAKLLKQLRAEMKILRDDLSDKLVKDQIESSSYIRGKEFYNALDSSIDALERPDARKQLTGAFAPRARNVQELVDFMTDNGLKFSPAMPGNENAYQVTHDAFVRYARTVEASAGFTSINSNAQSSGKKKNTK